VDILNAEDEFMMVKLRFLDCIENIRKSSIGVFNF